MTYNITLTANHQSLTAEYLPLAANSVQYLTAQIICETEDWTGREIKAMFGQGCTVHEVSVTDGEITAKQQLNLTAGDWRVWLVGNSARDGEVIPRITTNIAHISVAPTGGTEGNPFPTIPPTAEEQLRADMGNLADLTTEDKSSLVAAINEAAESGGGGAADAVTYTPQTLTTEQQKQARTNIGAYTKPASGIPKTDLAQSVQTSLAKADTAISLGLTAATPGQIIKVKAVQDGKPTEWEAVDMPGGGGDEWELIASGEVAEAANLKITKYSNGETLLLKAAQLLVDGPLAGNNGQFISVWASRYNSATDYDRYFVEQPLTSANPTVRLTYNYRVGVAPILIAELSRDTVEWQNAACQVREAIHRNIQSGYSNSRMAIHNINEVYCGANMGNVTLGAGCKYWLYGVRA
nr:MAG TPA: hypothetical protein [Caudoviricetes sp.]